MNFLVNLLTDFANVLRYLIPAFCYLGGGVLMCFAVVQMAESGRDPRQGMGHHLKIILTITVASLLLSYVAVVNLFSATFGGTEQIGLGGGLLAYTQPNLIGATLQESIGQVIQNVPLLHHVCRRFVHCRRHHEASQDRPHLRQPCV